MTERTHMPFFLTDEERMVMGAINMGHLKHTTVRDAVSTTHYYNVGGINVTDAVNRLWMWNLIGKILRDGEVQLVLTSEGMRAL